MTNVLALPQIGGTLTLVTNADLDEALLFTQAGSNTPLNLTGIVFRMQIRLASDETQIALDLSTDNGGLINGGVNGILSWFAPLTSTSQIAPGDYRADLLAIADGATRNLCQNGPITVTVNEGLTCSA